MYKLKRWLYFAVMLISFMTGCRTLDTVTPEEVSSASTVATATLVPNTKTHTPTQTAIPPTVTALQ